MAKSLLSLPKLLHKLTTSTSATFSSSPFPKLPNKPNTFKQKAHPQPQLKPTFFIPPKKLQEQKLESTIIKKIEDEKKRNESVVSSSSENEKRFRLSIVVKDCERRWFHDTLKQAKEGDIAMQLMIGQMYNSGYGVPRDPKKGRTWISKASRAKPSVWNSSEKQPGFNASDSESDDEKNSLNQDLVV